MMLWGGDRRITSCSTLCRGGQLFNLVAVFHSDRYVEGWESTEETPRNLLLASPAIAKQFGRLLAKVDTWPNVGAL